MGAKSRVKEVFRCRGAGIIRSDVPLYLCWLDSSRIFCVCAINSIREMQWVSDTRMISCAYGITACCVRD